MIAFEILFIPLLTIITIVISYISISIILNKRSTLGLIDNNPPALIEHISSSIGVGSLDVSEAWCNRTTIVSMDVEGAQKDLTLILFEADSVPQGTTLTFINNPASPATATLFIVGTNLNVALGRGQGITIINQRQIFVGITYENGNYGAQVEFPETQQILWKPFQNFAPDPEILCINAFNQVGALMGDNPYSTNLVDGPAAFTRAPQNDPDLSAPTWAASQCNCDPIDISKSVWCNL
jgi:hypothetical protein